MSVENLSTDSESKKIDQPQFPGLPKDQEGVLKVLWNNYLEATAKRQDFEKKFNDESSINKLKQHEKATLDMFEKFKKQFYESNQLKTQIQETQKETQKKFLEEFNRLEDQQKETLKKFEDQQKETQKKFEDQQKETLKRFLDGVNQLKDQEKETQKGVIEEVNQLKEQQYSQAKKSFDDFVKSKLMPAWRELQELEDLLKAIETKQQQEPSVHHLENMQKVRKALEAQRFLHAAYLMQANTLKNNLTNSSNFYEKIQQIATRRAS